MEDKIPMIMDNVFECTLSMIKDDFSEYPEHRVQFYRLLRAINLYCFPGKFRGANLRFKLMIDSSSTTRRTAIQIRH
jgi:exportin-1